MSSSSEAPLASLDLLRQITDRHVVDQLLAADQITRAEIAARTGISKPTISESVRRLEAVGLVAEAGHQLGRRGRAGTYYALAADLGFALAISAGPDGLIAETRDVRGRLLHRVARQTSSPVSAAQLDPLLRELVEDAVRRTPGPVRSAALSVAGPVDRRTGRLVQLPDSPFLVDELDPRALLSPLLGCELQIDNDVNWAALAEAREGHATELDDFFYCHLGYGLGGAIIRDGEPARGGGGLAGEIAHVYTAGPGGRSMRLIECFAGWDLLQAGSAAIDVGRLSVILAGEKAADRRLSKAIIEAVTGALCSITAVLNPSGILIGGPWSQIGSAQHRIAARLHEMAVLDTQVRSARWGGDGPLIGARLAAVRSAQDSLTPRRVDQMPTAGVEPAV